MHRRLLTLLLGTAFLAVAAFSQSPPPTKSGRPPASSNTNTKPFVLDGVVRDDDGRGIPGAVVYATSRNSATTDNTGHYGIEGLDRSVATYYIHVEKAGYKFVPDRSSLHPPATGNAHANFKAEPKKK